MHKFKEGEEVQVKSQTTGRWEDTRIVSLMEGPITVAYSRTPFDPEVILVPYTIDASYHPQAAALGKKTLVVSETRLRRKPKKIPPVVDFHEMINNLKNPNLIAKPEGEPA